FMHNARQSADPYVYDPAFDHGPALPQDAPADAVETVFTEQTHLDASPDSPPTADPSADPPGDTAAAEPVFTKQTHCDPGMADPLTTDQSADPSAAAAEPVFTKQTHCDQDPSSDDLPAPGPAASNVQPARSLGDVVAADLRGPNTILKLNRYEAHIERSLFKTLSELERLQHRRLARETAAPEPIDTELITNG
ncbi:MAG: hypothetical protein IH624_14660, partial [Phycisphaerae bacterium]|nr:hypothetical protein [Phycisphaerae bacterium]